VVTRLIAAFYPPCLKELTRVAGQSNQVPFLAKGTRITSPGWTELYPRKSARDDEHLPVEFVVGERGPHQPTVRQGETQPPKHFTENSLLGLLETAGKLVDDQQLREALKQRGLGTPATRAAIIETLLKRDYIRRSGKTLQATDLGRYLVALVQQPELKSPELTGEWEARLKQIELGQTAPEPFMKEIVDFTRDILRSSDVTRVDAESLGPCPCCGRPVIPGKRGFGCSGWRDGCKFVLWKTYQDHELSIDEIGRLIQHRVLLPALPVKGEDGERQRVVLYLTATGHLMEVPEPARSDQPPPRHKHPSRRPRAKSASVATTGGPGGKAKGPLGTCPLCGAEVVEQKKSYSCSNWKQGCKLTIWKTMAGKRIGRRTAQSLLRTGKTSQLKGFRSRQGKTFEARLTLRDGQVRFEFGSDG
jgi:DNA topoisomerase-3